MLRALRVNPRRLPIRANTVHFLQRVQERASGLSPRKRRRLNALVAALSSGVANTTGMHGRYAIQFGGEPGQVGDYLVTNVTNGRADGFISLLVNQSVVVSGTAVVPLSRVLPAADRL